MQIYINTIDYQKLSDLKEEAAKTGASASELEQIDDLMAPDLSAKTGHIFTPGEWRTLDAAQETELLKWIDEDPKNRSHIKPAHTVLEEKLAQRIREDGLQSFAYALKLAHEDAHEDAPEITATVLKVVTYEEPQ